MGNEAANAGTGIVSHTRQELVTMLPTYQRIADCIAGTDAIKLLPERYLPRPNAADTSPANVARYSAYLMRAVFYNVVARTREGLSGQIFVRDPEISVPEVMQPIVDAGDGTGLSLIQLAKQAVDYVIAFGRAGLFVDYPKVDGVTSREDIASGKVRPTLTVYGPTSIINWRTKLVNAKVVLSLVVLSEFYVWEDDGFQEYIQRQFRVLRLDENGNYRVELWKSPVRQGTNYQLDSADITYPTDANGDLLDEIPFLFLGVRSNDSTMDAAPFAALADLNIGHYRNSADYEESCYTVGQPTLFVSGLTQEWFDGVLQGHIPFGSREGVPLPVDAKADMIQVAPNTMPYEAMKQKEQQMLAIGANLVDDKQRIQRTATDAVIQASSELSTLASSAQNVSLAFQWGLEWAAAFLGLNEDDVSFELNTDFSITKLSAADRQQTLLEWQSGLTAYSEARNVLRKGGVATLDDAAARAETEADAILATAEFNPNLAKQPVAPAGPGGGDPAPNPGNGRGSETGGT